MKKRRLLGNQKIFINVANNDYGYLVNPKTILSDTLMRIKANALVDYKETQAKLIKILNGIIKEKKLQDSDELKYFMEARERLSFRDRVENGRLIRTVGLRPIPYPNWFRELIPDFVDFLSGPQNDIKKINKCNNCGIFYIAGKLDPRQKYCSEKCGNAARRLSPEKFKEYQKKRREEEKLQREIEIKKVQIQRLMNVGYSRKEAEIEWKKSGKEMLVAAKEFKIVKRDRLVKRQTSRFT